MHIWFSILGNIAHINTKGKSNICNSLRKKRAIQEMITEPQTTLIIIWVGQNNRKKRIIQEMITKSQTNFSHNLSWIKQSKNIIVYLTNVGTW